MPFLFVSASISTKRQLYLKKTQDGHALGGALGACDPVQCGVESQCGTIGHVQGSECVSGPASAGERLAPENRHKKQLARNQLKSLATQTLYWQLALKPILQRAWHYCF